MPKKIQNDGARDLKIDSARSLVPIVPGATDLPDGIARGIWLCDAAPATVDYQEEDGTARADLLLIPGPNMFVVKRVTGGTAVDMRAIY